MTLSRLPLSYCTNVHPGRTVAEVANGLEQHTARVRERLDAPIAAGLWLARSVVDELMLDVRGPERLKQRLDKLGLTCHTLNAFPYGDFHGERVKENVYLPDWSDTRRLEYTADCARVLCKLLPDGVDGSISTVPLGFKRFEHPPGFEERCIENLIELTRRLMRTCEETGRRIRLAIEPEPLCLLETTGETLAFFDRLRKRADDEMLTDAVAEHLGVCYDVCHQSVEFEDVEASIAQIAAAGVRINKVHITCAIELRDPRENEAGRRALAEFVEPRYLHQTFARSRDGDVVRAVDLTRDLALNPPDAFASADLWRVHFHVPVDAESLGPLSTTRADLRRAVEAVAALDYAPHLEVETYTWNVLPGADATALNDGLTRELAATSQLVAQVD